MRTSVSGLKSRRAARRIDSVKRFFIPGKYLRLAFVFIVLLFLLWVVVYLIADYVQNGRVSLFPESADAAACRRSVGKTVSLPVQSPYTYRFHADDITMQYRPAKLFCTEDIKLLIMVKSAHGNWMHRYTIRNTWGSFNACRDAAYAISGRTCAEIWKHTRLLFVVGEAVKYDPQDDLNVRFEAESHGDVVQFSLMDTFHNLTLKVLSMYDWTTIHCPRVTHILSTDDDTYVNLGNLWMLLGELLAGRMSNSAIYGHRMPGPSFIRDKNSKWYIPLSVADDNFKIPNYIFAWHMLMSYESMLKLYNAAKCLPILCIDDLFLSGIVAQGVGVPIVKSPCVDWHDISKIPSETTGEEYSSIIATHFGESNLQRLSEVWKQVILYGKKTNDFSLVKTKMAACFKPTT